MAQAAILERGDDDNWSAYIHLEDSLVIGLGGSEAEALMDLRRGVQLLIDHKLEENLLIPLSLTDHQT